MQKTRKERILEALQEEKKNKKAKNLKRVQQLLGLLQSQPLSLFPESK